MARQQIRIELDSKGIKQLLQGAEVGDDIKRRTDAVARRAGEGMRSSTYTGRDRVRGMVWTGTAEARKAEAESRALLKALDAARE